MPQTTIKLSNQDYYNYIGQIGEWLFKTELATQTLIHTLGWEIREGHEPFEFGGELLQHLDFLLEQPQPPLFMHTRLQHVIEVKTTHNQTKKVFKLNGQCGSSLAKLREVNIPASLAVIRIKPNFKTIYDISKRAGFDAECTRMRAYKLYNVEIYNEQQLEITEKQIKIV